LVFLQIIDDTRDIKLFISHLQMLVEYITIFCRMQTGAEAPFDREYLHTLQFC